jgi:hypothetical protein
VLLFSAAGALCSLYLLKTHIALMASFIWIFGVWIVFEVNRGVISSAFPGSGIFEETRHLPLLAYCLVTLVLARRKFETLEIQG